MQSKSVSIFLIAVALLVSASALEAQIRYQRELRNLELGTLPIQFSLAPPGARSLGMGGAFIAIADDATASEANPAGLTILTRPEFSFHVRDYSFDGQIDDPKTAIAFRVANEVRDDEASGARRVPRPEPLCGPNAVATHPVTGQPLTCVDVPAGSSTRDLSDSSTDFSFVSYVKPLPKWVFSVYYNRFANFSAVSDIRLPTGGLPGFSSLDGGGIRDDVLLDFYQGSTTTQILAESLGVSGAFKITSRLAFGVSARITELDVNNRDFLQINYFSDLELETFQFGESLPPFRPTMDQFSDILLSERKVTGSDTQLTYNLGLLFDANQRFSAGVVFKEGGKFDIPRESRFFDCISLQNIDPVIISKIVDDPGQFPTTPCVAPGLTADGREKIFIPDLLGAGFAFRPNDRLTLALDLNYISYSDLDPAPIRDVTEPINDELEVHVGGEYVFLPGSSGYPVTLRAGYFNEPDHDGFANIDSSDDHFTVGAGMVVKGQYQFDIAGSFSDRQDVVLFSFVYRQ